MADFNITLTEQGRMLLAKGLAGSGLRFKSILLGDGVGSGEMDSLRLTLPVTGVTRQGEQAAVRAVLSLAELTETFYWKELGVTALDPDSGEELLYAYGSSMEGDLISHAGTLTEKQIAVVLMVQSDTEVSAVIDESLVFLKKEDLDSLSKKVWAELSCTKSGTVFALSGNLGEGLVQCSFTAPDVYAKGDTFQVNGESYAVKQQNGEEAGDKLFATGAVVSCIIDTAGKTVNFKSGGGGKGGLTKYATGTVSTTTASSSAKCKGTITDLAFEPQVLVLVGKSNGVKGGTVIFYNDTISIFSIGGFSSYIEEDDGGLEITFNGNSISFIAALEQSGLAPTVTYKVYG